MLTERQSKGCFCARLLEKISQIAEVEAELKPDHMSYTRGIAFLVAVGEGMRTTVGTCLHVVTALSRAGVNLQMINQGSSELSIMFGIREVDMKPAVQALYREFFGS